METMISLPTVQQDLLFSQLFPDVNLTRDDVIKVVYFINAKTSTTQIIPRVISGIDQIVKYTGKGQVIVHVREDMANVEVRHTGEDISLR
jgi:hypothetical protein